MDDILAGGSRGSRSDDRKSRPVCSSFLLLIISFLERGCSRDRIRERGNAVSREALLNAVWGVEYYGTIRTLDHLIVKLRRKIEDVPAEPRHFPPVHTLGYRLEV